MPIGLLFYFLLILSLLGCSSEHPTRGEEKQLDSSDPSLAPLLSTQAGRMFIQSPWDVNGDGKVDIFDLTLVAQHLGQTTAPEGNTPFTSDEHTLYIQHFDRLNGTDETALFGQYSLGPGSRWLTIHTKDIGLWGNPEYTIEFWWLPSRWEDVWEANLFYNTAPDKFQFPLGIAIEGDRGQFRRALGEGRGGEPVVGSRWITLQAEKWYYISVAGSFDEGTHSIYVDDVEISRTTSVYLEQGWQATDLTFTPQIGFIDELRISKIDRNR